MTTKIEAITIAVLAVLHSVSLAVELPLSSAEALVARLATAELASERHPLPGFTLSLFADSMNDGILKEVERNSWTITTVRKSGRFEFIHAETDGLAIRQLPEVFMIGFAPTSPNWLEQLPETVHEFLRNNVEGDWEKVRVDAPKRVGGLQFIESAGGGFSHKKGTIRDSFIAVVVENRVWVCLPKRRNFEGTAGWVFSIDENLRWFSRYPRQK